MNGPRESDAAGGASPADDDDSPTSGLQFFLVRLIPAGTVCWVGSIHRMRHPASHTPVRRGDRVVVHNTQGEWLAEVLKLADPANPSVQNASGELLRVATPEDERAEEDAIEQGRALYEATVRDRLASDVAIVATEVSLDHRVGVIRILGPADDRFGPAAVRLATDLGLQRVQWIDVSQDQPAEPTRSSARGGEATMQECTPEEAEAAAFWQRMQQVVGEAVSLGATHRVAAGNRGLYQQKLRGDEQTVRRPRGPTAKNDIERRWMIRIRTAAGGVTAGQLEKLCGIAMRFGDGSIRVTTRQAIQLHGVALGAGPEVMRQLQAALLRTAGSCGNTVRNLTCCALPPRSAAERHLRECAARLARNTLPVGPAFECEPEWLHGEPTGASSGSAADVGIPPDRSPLAPALPHKWKIGLAVAGHNCVDVLNNDLAIVLRRDGQFGAGPPLADIFIGGSTAYQPDRPGSRPRLASWLGTISTAEIAELLAALMELFQSRVIGERRHFRRWKYLVDRLGTEEIRSELRGRWPVGRALQMDQSPPSPDALRSIDHPLATVQADGRVAFCVPLPGGRLRCDEAVEEAFHRFARLPITVRIAPQHRLVVADVRHQDLSSVQQTLAMLVPTAAADLQQANDAAGSLPTETALACPALPTCPLAVDEAERVLPIWRQVVQDVAAAHNLPLPNFAISGCGNGCSRPLTTEIGLVAEKRGKRRVFFGGNGSRLGRSVGTVGNPNDFRSLLETWLSRYAASRRVDEDFSDWFFRSWE